LKHGYLDRYSGRKSLLHRLDPRTKIICIFAAVAVIVSEPRGEISCFLAYLPLVFLLVILGRIPLVFILQRCLVASPFILMAAALVPLSFGIGRESAGVTHAVPLLAFSLSILFKAFSAVILLTLLLSTDRFHRLLKGMRNLRMPAVLGLMSSLMYRYIFILNDERLRTSRARISRTPGKLRLSPYRVYGQQAAMIFLRGWKRAHTVYDSMLSRGFRGDFPEFERLRFDSRDAFFSIVLTLILTGIRIWV
jgi:cobalt/nickel transport system permease protein